MNSSTRKRIIIHKYSLEQETPSTEIYNNDTFNANPTSSSKPIKKIQLSKVHNSLKCNQQKHPSFITEMVQMKEFKKEALAKFQHERKVHTETRKHSLNRAKTIDKSMTKAKVKKIFLPNLKKFDDFNYEVDRIPTHNRKQPQETERNPTSINYENQETIFPQSRIKTDQALKRTPTPKRERINTQRIENDNSSSNYAKSFPSKRLYKYLENYLNSDSRYQRQSPTREEDEPQSVSSFSPTYQKESHVIFHNFKHKTLEQSRQKSSNLLSQPLFNISQIKEKLNDFVLTYIPLDRHFDLKQFIKDPQVEIISNDKYIFAGKIINDKMQGKGVLISQKQLYEGEFVNNHKKTGIEKNKNGVYHGTYEFGRRSGTGKFVWSNGETYEGEWRLGKKNGHGIWRSPKGDYYEGQWKENLQSGKGCYYHKGCSMYRGYFKNSLKHGRGEQQFQNGDKYQGDYIQGKPHGYGKYSWANEDTYSGDFVQGSRSGKGTLRKATGQTYEGHFKEDLKQGFGKQTYLKGEYFQGQFQRGVKLSGSYFSKQGKAIQTY